MYGLVPPMPGGDAQWGRVSAAAQMRLMVAAYVVTADGSRPMPMILARLPMVRHARLTLPSPRLPLTAIPRTRWRLIARRPLRRKRRVPAHQAATLPRHATVACAERASRVLRRSAVSAAPPSRRPRARGAIRWAPMLVGTTTTATHTPRHCRKRLDWRRAAIHMSQTINTPARIRHSMVVVAAPRSQRLLA